MGKLPRFTPKEVRANLRSLGFVHKRTDGSHEQWERAADATHPRAVVTVVASRGQFSAWLMSNMIRQSKLTKEEFCSGQLTQTPQIQEPVKERKEHA